MAIPSASDILTGERNVILSFCVVAGNSLRDSSIDRLAPICHLIYPFGSVNRFYCYRGRADASASSRTLTL